VKPPRDQNCQKKRKEDVPNLKASVSGVEQQIIWFLSVNCHQTFLAILASSRALLLPYVNAHHLSGRLLRIVQLVIHLNCNSSTPLGRQCNSSHLLPPFTFPSRDTKIIISLHRSFHCD